MKRTRKEEDDSASEQNTKPAKRQKLSKSFCPFSEDVLQHLFEYLQFRDLVQVQLVCKQFEHAMFSSRRVWSRVCFDASQAIPTKYLPMISRLNMQKQLCSLNKICNLTHIKYPSLKMLKANAHSLQNLTLKSHVIPCVMPQVTHLTLQDVAGKNVNFARLPQLKHLVLLKCDIKDANAFFSHLDKLEHLKVTECSMQGVCAAESFPSLRTFQLEKEAEFDNSSFAHPIPTLEKLTVDCIFDFETLDFASTIKSLKVTCGADLKQDHLDELPELEELFISKELPDLNYSGIQKLTMTNCMKGNGNPTDRVKNSPDLTELSVFEDSMQWTDLNDLVQAIANMEKTIQCSISVTDMEGALSKFVFPPEHVSISIANVKNKEHACVQCILNRQKNCNMNEFYHNMSPEQLQVYANLNVYSVMKRLMLDIPEDVEQYWKQYYDDMQDSVMLKSILFKVVE